MTELVQLGPHQQRWPVVGVLAALCLSVALMHLYPTAADRSPFLHEESENSPAPELHHGQAHALSGPQKDGYGAPLAAYVVADYRRSALVAAPLDGQVERVFVVYGDEVRRGDPLFRMTSADLTALQGQIARATTEVEERRNEHARLRARVGVTPLATTQVLAAGASLRRAERELFAAKAKRSLLDIDPDDPNSSSLIVRAPLDGTVIQSALRVGQQLPAKQTVLHIADTSEGVFVEVDVPAPEIHALEIGTVARIELQAEEYSAPLFAQISAISDVVDDRHQTVRVRVPVRDQRLQIDQALPIQFQLRQVETMGRF